MNYVIGNDREQIRVESFEEYVEKDSEVRVIDKIVDAMNIESMEFNIGNNDALLIEKLCG